MQLREYLTAIKNMAKSSITESITEIIEPVIEEENLELVDVEYKKFGKNWTLRVFIDREGGITVEDCQKVSRQIEDMIEIDELISNAYVLEVSSPGLDRSLKKEREFLKFRNKPIRVKTFAPVGDRKNFSGTIQDCQNQILYLELEEDGTVLEISLDNIAQAKLIIQF